MTTTTTIMATTRSIAVIDPYIETPALINFNELVFKFPNFKFTYHAPSKFGFDSLNALSKIDGIIILGSYSHVHENLPWHKELLNFVIPLLENDTPVLGICFGHQLIAHYYGSELGFLTPDEFFYQEVRETNYQGKTLKLIYSQAQTISKLSDKFESLATSERSPFEIIRHKTFPFTGVQSHPEASLELVKKLGGDETVKECGMSLIEEFLNKNV